MASSIARAAQPAGTPTAVGVAGLNAGEVRRRLVADGPNTLPSPHPPSPLLLLVRQLTHFFALMLWIAATLGIVGGMPQLGAAIAIVVVINGGFAFAQEYRADQAGQRLRDLLPVRRPHHPRLGRGGHARRTQRHPAARQHETGHGEAGRGRAREARKDHQCRG